VSLFDQGHDQVPDRKTRSYTWFYSLNVRLKTETASSTAELQPFVDSSGFGGILSSAPCQGFQESKLGKATINSFSIDTRKSSVFNIDGVLFSHIVGFISCGHQMRCGTVQDWLTRPGIFNLELTPIANRDTNDKILTFLRESALADDPAHAAGDKRLRVDLLEASAGAATRGKSTGRPPKNPGAPRGEPTVTPSTDESAAPASVAAPPRAPSRLRVQYHLGGSCGSATSWSRTENADMVGNTGRAITAP
jgi:hypothetical protein